MHPARILLAAVAAAPLALAAGGVAQAADQDFTLMNRTGYEIENVFVSETRSRSWGEDVMGRDTLSDGESVHIRFRHAGNACQWDLKVRYTDGDEATWDRVNLCEVSRVTLFWDRRNQVTRAKAE